MWSPGDGNRLVVKAVLFDLFETLITESRLAPRRASSLGDVLGLDHEAFRTAWTARRPRVVLGELSFSDALADICQSLTGCVDVMAVDRVRVDRIREKDAAFQEIDRDVVGLIDTLRQHGIRLAVVSNCFAEDVVSWPTCPLAPQFHCAVFSFAVGLAKPDPRIYLEATRRLGVDPATALFIGDGGDNELAGAEQAGLSALRAVWFLRRWPNFRPPEAVGQQVAACKDVLPFVAVGGRHNLNGSNLSE